MKNTGVEISINADIINTPDFKLSAGGNITFISNEITVLPDAILEGTKRREEGRDFQIGFVRFLGIHRRASALKQNM